MKFLKSVKEVMKKVTWPSGKQLRRDTIIVIQTSLAFALFFFIVDTALRYGITWIVGN
ncbi:preprotein translocase subunit SecE [Enterococcus sp. HY326]|uniref:preprotein translocase subunit SecE n=1 Tax=Enterococcus sp. HY326 TaxID=2971265 RepID=UPI00223F1848|nr:preprotein translocase subunit SecE [Enterococcus sp. HY326]